MNGDLYDYVIDYDFSTSQTSLRLMLSQHFGVTRDSSLPRELTGTLSGYGESP